MAPKLKEKHIEFPPFQAMCVNLAAQGLSHSVAAGISTLVTLKYLPEQAVKTATFIDHFDALFNTFNSKSLKSTQQMGHAFQQSSSHRAFLEKSLNVLSKIQTLDGHELPCITGWKICIHALFQLWEYLSKEAGFKFLLTNCLNQDCIENLFGIICYKGGFRDNPDCEQFRDAFHHVIAENIFVHSEKANCKIDTDHILLDIANVAMAKQEKKVPCKDVFAVPFNEIVDIPLSLPARNASAYVAGYLLRKYPMTDCQQCQNKCKLVKMPENNALYEFLKEKAYTEVSGLTYPTVCMIMFVEELESLFSSTFEAIAHMSSVICCLCNSAQIFPRV